MIKSILIKMLCSVMPNSVLKFFILNKYVNQHQYPASTLIHRRKGKVIFEVEFNWYDSDLLPISLVREVHSGNRFSVSFYEMYEFKEFAGNDRSIGDSIDGNYSQEI